jgi:hypothetical protein
VARQSAQLDAQPQQEDATGEARPSGVDEDVRSR